MAFQGHLQIRNSTGFKVFSLLVPTCPFPSSVSGPGFWSQSLLPATNGEPWSSRPRVSGGQGAWTAGVGSPRCLGPASGWAASFMRQEPNLTGAAASGSHLLPAAYHRDLPEIEEGSSPQTQQLMSVEPKTH